MNPILEELHAVREKLLRDAGGTLEAFVDRLQAEDQQSDRPRYKPRTGGTPRVINGRGGAGGSSTTPKTTPVTEL